METKDGITVWYFCVRNKIYSALTYKFVNELIREISKTNYNRSLIEHQFWWTQNTYLIFKYFNNLLLQFNSSYNYIVYDNNTIY